MARAAANRSQLPHRSAAPLPVRVPARTVGALGVSRPCLFAEQSAASIGWAPRPFQYEVGVANLGLALAALYAAFRGYEARLAVGIAAACFLIGAGIGHIRDIVEAGNLAPGNAGPIMVTDFLTPIAVLALLFVANGKRRPKSPATLALEAELENARKAMRQYRTALSQLGKD